MALKTYLDHFQVSTGVAGTTFARTGYGFAPQAVIIWCMGLNTSVDDAAFFSHRRGVGMAVSTSSRWCVAAQSVDNVTTSSCDKMARTDSVIGTLTTGGALEALLDVSAFGTDGLTFIIDDAFPSELEVVVFAIGSTGGNPITNLAIAGFDQATATGNDDITTVGFQPDFVFLLGSLGTGAEPSIATGAGLAIGACDASLNQWAYGSRCLDGQGTSDNGTYMRSGQVIAVPTTAAGIGTCLVRASITSMLSNGFRLNYAEADANVRRFGYLAIKGGVWNVGTIASQTDTVTAITASCGLKPSGGLFVSAGRAESTDDTPTAHDHWSMGGFASATSRHVLGLVDWDNDAITDVLGVQEFDEAYLHLPTDGTVGADGMMDMQSINPKGFTGIMDDADPSASMIGYIVCADRRTGVVGIGHVADHR